MTDNREILLLIDTGADISLIKHNRLSPRQVIKDSFSKIKGITNETVQCLGYTQANLFINDYRCSHSFQVIDSNFPIPADGILGRDFIAKFKCKLDYEYWTMLINVNNYDTTEIPIHNSPKEGILTIPPRCEVIRAVRYIFDDKEKVVMNNEISAGVFVASTIATKKSPFVRIINTTSESVTVETKSIITKNLNDFDIFKIDNSETDRENQLLTELNTDIPKFVKKDMLNLCKEFSDIFGLKSDKITVNNFYKQKLRMADNTPVYIKNYRTPQVQVEEINNQVSKLLKNDIIEPSEAEYNSPLLLVPKKSTDDSKKWRLVIDYRQLNKKLIGDKFPLPRLDDILDQLGRAKWFSVVDLVSGFHQIPLDVNSRDVTSFSTNNGSFRFTRLPFGLKVSPNSFQRMMSLAFAGITPEKAFLYMDDLIVIGCSKQHHLTNLRKVFETCRRCNLKLNPEKCRFFKSEVTFLGHKVTDKGILPDESKFSAIKNYPVPKSPAEVKRFVAFCNYYRRFIPKFAEITQSLNKLIRKNVKFQWSDDCQKSYETLKAALLHPNILQYPDFSKSFILTTDASKEACGAILSQEYGEDDLPIAYASKSFTKGEINKSTIEKELTAIHWAIKYFKPYLYGRKFIVKSDHRALIYLFSLKDPSSKLARMRLDLEEFDFEIQYIKGKDNVAADALSRITLEDLKNIHSFQVCAITRSMAKSTVNQNVPQAEVELKSANEPKIIEFLNEGNLMQLPNVLCIIDPYCLRISMGKKNKHMERILQVTKGDISCVEILSQLGKMAGELGYKKVKLCTSDEIFNWYTIKQFKESGAKVLKNLQIVLYKKPTIIRNQVEKKQILEKFHNDPIYGGHCGQKRFLKKLKCEYKWKNMSKDVNKFVKSCEKCQINKAKVKNKEQMVITPTPQKAFDITCIDTIGPFLKSDRGNVYAVTLQCELTKYVVIIPIPNKEAKTIAKAIFNNFILVYGPMKEIRTDMGTEYKNEVIENLTKMLRIEHKISTAYHSQSIGGCERNHRVFNEYMRSYINDTRTDWDEWIPYYSFCYNTTPSVYHDYTPFELLFGRKAEIPSKLTASIEPVYDMDAYEREIAYRLQVTQQRVQNYLEKAKVKRKLEYDRDVNENIIQPGDKVIITNENRSKFDPWYKGPYQVINCEGVNCTIKNEQGKSLKVHKNRLKLYYS